MTTTIYTNRVLQTFLFLIITLNIRAQGVPEKINYQAVARNASGTPLTNASISVTFDIISGSSTGTVEYSESQNLITNQFGLFTAEIGSGSVISGVFSTIPWTLSSHYLRVTVNGNVMPATQLLSVPYALHANTAATGTPGADGHNGLVIPTIEPSGVNCINGGYKMESGLDLDDNGQLSVNEISSTFYICNGSGSSSNDTSATNELQNITKTGNIVTLSLGGGSFIDAVDDADADPTNEIELPNNATSGDVLFFNGTSWIAQSPAQSSDNQDLSLFGDSLSLTNDPTPVDLSPYRDNTDSQVLTYSSTGQQLSISGGNAVTLSVDDGDADPTNELELPNTANTGDVLFYDGTTWIAQSIATGTDSQDLINGGKSGNNQTIDIQNGAGLSFSVADQDSSITNEIQDLSITGNNVNISGGVGTSLSTITPNVGDYLYWDGNSWIAQAITAGVDNQDLVLSGDSLTLTNDPTPVDLSPFKDNTDSQNLSYDSGTNELSISGGNTVSLGATSTPSYTAGTGISIVANTITNTLPDQTVSIIGGPATTVSGSYPNFSISTNINDADSDPNNEIELPSTASTGDGLFYDGAYWVAQSPSDADNQNLSYNLGTQELSISGGNSVFLFVDDADASITNELINSFSINGTADSVVIDEGTSRHSLPLSAFGGNAWTKGAGTVYNNSDKIGIGTSSPGVALQIEDAENSTALNAFGGSSGTTLRINNTDQTDNNFSSLSFTSLLSNSGTAEMGKIATQNVNHTIGFVRGDLVFLTRDAVNLNERMRITGDGKVGIGTVAPNQLLDVDNGGSIEVDGEYTYENAKVHYLTYSWNGFQSDRPDQYVFGQPSAAVSDSYGLFLTGTAGDSAYASAPLNLPDDAVITELRVWLYDSLSTAPVRVRLYRQALGTGTKALRGTIESSTTTAIASVQELHTNLAEVIDNRNFSYQLSFEGEQNNFGTRLYHIKITYTVQKAD